MHIRNLYADQTILMFRECYALEKVHGTSAHVAWDGAALRFFSGGENHGRFVALFDGDALAAKFREHCGEKPLTVYGEAYGGTQQGMRATYGDALCFIAFDVKGGDAWLDVPKAAALAGLLGFEFVPWRRIHATVEAIDAQRDLPSEVAVRRGIAEPRVREGVVLRPPVEVVLNNGERIIAKHKRDEFRETKAPRLVDDPAKLAILTAADAVAEEWVTPMRLRHVLDKLLTGGEAPTMRRTPDVIRAMVEDVIREAGAEVTDSKDVRKAIGARAAHMFKHAVTRIPSGGEESGRG